MTIKKIQTTPQNKQEKEPVGVSVLEALGRHFSSSASEKYKGEISEEHVLINNGD